MEVIFVLILLSFILSLGGLMAFFWANRDGQFEDLSRSAEEILVETDPY